MVSQFLVSIHKTYNKAIKSFAKPLVFRVLVSGDMRQSKNMSKIVAYSILLFMHINSVYAQDIPKDGLDIVLGLSPKFELATIDISDLSEDSMSAKAAVLFTILLHTSEVDIHRMRGAIHNQVYSDLEGHEAVFEYDLDENGLPIEGTSREITFTDCMNMANFNFFLPKEFPFGHFTVDILPWMLRGNCQDDPTSMSERIDAYVLDFQSGMTRLINTQSGYYHPKFIDGKNNNQLEALSFLLKALELGGFDMSALAPIELRDEEIRSKLATALKMGLKVMLLEA